jgi:6-phosphogluconolactonase/glucosamine-6-phosphate isomerase/deaminase
VEIRGRQGHRVIIADTPQAVWQKAAELFALSAAHAIAARGRFTTALAGGTTPQALYELLAADKYRQIISWEKVFIFWGMSAASHPVMLTVTTGCLKTPC